MNHLDILMVLGFTAVAIPFALFAARLMARVLPMPGEESDR